MSVKSSAPKTILSNPLAKKRSPRRFRSFCANRYWRAVNSIQQHLPGQATLNNGNQKRRFIMSIKVLVVDDSLFMRTLVSDLLNSDQEIVVVDTAKEGKEAVNKIIRFKPDCVTLDLAMPGWDGLTPLKHIM